MIKKQEKAVRDVQADAAVDVAVVQEAVIHIPTLL